MDEVFELITATAKEDEEKELRLGIRIKVGGYEAVCPLTPRCRSYRTFELEMEKIRKKLEAVSIQARTVYERPGREATFGIEPHMAAGEIWAILSAIAPEDVFVTTFNTLEDAKRREIAEHVLTKCNVFSGKASVFSARYSEATALME
jgi:hypothetical protein